MKKQPEKVLTLWAIGIIITILLSLLWRPVIHRIAEYYQLNDHLYISIHRGYYNAIKIMQNILFMVPALFIKNKPVKYALIVVVVLELIYILTHLGFRYI